MIRKEKERKVSKEIEWRNVMEKNLIWGSGCGTVDGPL